jgi:hypothetical protein
MENQLQGFQVSLGHAKNIYTENPVTLGIFTP